MKFTSKAATYLTCTYLTLGVANCLADSGSELSIVDLRMTLTDLNLADQISPNVIFPLTFSSTDTPYPNGSIINLQARSSNPSVYAGPTLFFTQNLFEENSGELNFPVTRTSASFSGNLLSSTGASINLQSNALGSPGKDAFAASILSLDRRGEARKFELPPYTNLTLTGQLRVNAFADPNAFERQEFANARVDLSFSSVNQNLLFQHAFFNRSFFAGSAPGAEYINHVENFSLDFRNDNDFSQEGAFYAYFATSTLANEAVASPVPEPSEICMLGAGILCITCIARRRRAF